MTVTFRSGLVCFQNPSPRSSQGSLPQRTLPFLSQWTPWHLLQTRQSRRGPRRVSLHLSRAPRRGVAESSAPGLHATVKQEPGAASRAAQVRRLRDGADKCRAGAARAEPGTAFARAEAEAGAFGGRDRGNPETPGLHRAGGGYGDGRRRRCGSAVALDPADSAAWGARRS